MRKNDVPPDAKKFSIEVYVTREELRWTGAGNAMDLAVDASKRKLDETINTVGFSHYGLTELYEEEDFMRNAVRVLLVQWAVPRTDGVWPSVHAAAREDGFL